MKGILFFLFVYLTVPAYCQDVYVKPDNSIVTGTILNYKEWSKNPSIVIFKDSTGNTINLDPTNCKSFTARASDKYISYSGNRILNGDNIENKHALQSNILTRENINVFLRQIYQYKEYTLYKYFDNKRSNFYLEKNGLIKELEYYEYEDNSGQVKTFDNYKFLLLQELEDKNIPNVQDKLNDLAYSENDLINFFAGVLED
jgi:hypothetical protein